MKFILGLKKNMSQVFDASGVVHSATVVTAGPVTVTQIKDAERDGYVAVQVGFGSIKAEKLSKPQKGHLKEIGSFPILKEFRLSKEDAALLAAAKVRCCSRT